MSKKMLIDATHAEETRIVVVEGNKVDEFDFESLNRRQIAGNIYLAKVIRVEPSLQAAFVDYGGNRHGFLAFSEIHPDYYQIPVADREALIAEEEAYALAMAAETEKHNTETKTATDKNSTKTIEIDTVPDPVIIDVDDDDNGLVSVPENTPKAADEGMETPSTNTNGEINNQNTSKEDDKDDDIESISDDDIDEEVRPIKPRLRRYKIQEVINARQIILVQISKEERGNKGAALTTYLSLAGRYCVLMPNTARGGGISRKITNPQDRKTIKAITSDLELPKGSGLIVRTAGAKRTKDDIMRDFEYLMRQWEEIRTTTLNSIAPVQIYAEGDIIKRSIRDLYNSDIDEILVEGKRGFTAAQAYMGMLMPTHIDRVKEYKDRLPLYIRYQVESYLGGIFNPTVQLVSGGYLVINITEALVAIDINSGKATNEKSIEKTALKTNLEAAKEIARQLRLRDLAGLIVIDFIDMDDRRNNSAVEKKLKEALKNDRARIQVGRISGFGLLEMSRQRLRPGMLESTTTLCSHCQGTGIIRSDDSQALYILRAIEEMATHKNSREIAVSAPITIANYLLNHKRRNINAIETQYNTSIIIEATPNMVGSEYALDKRKESSRIIDDVIDLPSEKDVERVIEAAQRTIEEVNSEAPVKPKKHRRRKPKADKEHAKKTSPAKATDAPIIDEPIAAVTPPIEQERAPSENETPPKPKRKRRTKAEIEAAKAEKNTQETPSETTEKVKPKKRNQRKAPPVKINIETSDPVENQNTDMNDTTKISHDSPPPNSPPKKPKKRGWWSRE